MGSIPTKEIKPKKGIEFKCRACKRILPLEQKSETASSGKMHYCLSCAKKKFKEAEKTKNIKEVPFGTEEFKNNSDIYSGDPDNVQYENIREVVDYILDLFHLNSKEYYANITQQVKYLINKSQCNYKGIYLTLKYYYILLENPIPLEEVNIISIVSSYYGAALRLYRLQNELEKNADELVSETAPIVNVYVSRSAQKEYNDYYENKWRCYENMISIDDIEITEENDGV